ncbi:hypothetical protein V5K30_RS21295 [Enterobacter hormaechei]
MFIEHEEKAADAAFSISDYSLVQISGKEEGKKGRKGLLQESTKNGELL